MSENHSGFEREIRFPKPRPAAKKPRISKTSVALMACIVLLLGAVVWMAWPDPEATEGATEETLKAQFQEQCYEDLRDQLRDPDSAKFESETGVIISSDDGQYTILGEGRARNGFGGMNNFRIACTAYYDEDTETFDLESQIID